MNALKRSMLWDEVNYDREYDLSIFQMAKTISKLKVTVEILRIILILGHIPV